MSRSRARSAFTLIEVLIVVVIVGILAAIVLPQYHDASVEAANTNLVGQLQTIRSQMGAYNVLAHMRGWPMYNATRAAPGDNTFWDDLIAHNYIQQAPRNPHQDPATSEVVGAAPAPDVGWVWDGDDILATDGNGVFFNEFGP